MKMTGTVDEDMFPGDEKNVAPPLHPDSAAAIHPLVFRRSSAVEQLTVNQLVVGSIPTAGAIIPS